MSTTMRRTTTMIRIRTALILIGLPFFLTSIPSCVCFTPTRRLYDIRSSQNLPLFEKQNNVVDATSTSSVDESVSRQESGTTKNPLELASWYAAEAFGKVFGTKRSDCAAVDSDQDSESIDLTKPPSSLEETLKRIQLDNDRSYFLTGEVDGLIYDEKCTFADPFVSFDGRDRFIDNLSNLGSFITNYDAKLIKFEVEDDGREIVTKVMVKLELNLPWKPVLAWPWGVSYSIDPVSFLVTKHIESWDIEPLKGVAQIFRRPTVKIGNKQ